MDKRSVDAIKYLDSIIEIAGRLKAEIEQEIISVDIVTLDSFKKADSELDLTELYLKG